MLFRPLYLLSAGLLLAHTTYAQPLTESDVIQLGLSHPSVQQLTTAKQQGIDAEIAQNRLWHNPTMAISHEKLAEEKEISLELEQTIDWSGRRGLRENKLALEQEQLTQENLIFIAQRKALLLDTFYELLHSQQKLQLVQEWSNRFERAVDIIRKQTESGETSKYALRRIKTEQQNILLQLAEKQAEHARLQILLSGLLTQSIGDGVTGKLQPDHLVPLVDLEQQLSNHPELLAKKIQLEITKTDRDIADNQIPEVTLGLGTKQASEQNIRHTGMMFSVSLDLPVFERGEEQVKRSEAEYKQAEAEFVLLEQKLKAELTGLYQQLSQLLTASRHYQSTVQDTTPVLLKTAETAYQAGEFSLYELLDSYQSAVEAELRYLGLQLKTRQVNSAINRLLTGGAAL